MSEEIERLKYRVKDLRYKLEVLEVDRIEVSAEQGEHMGNSPEYARWGLWDLVFAARREELEAKLRAAELALARVELEAEWERLKQLQPCPSIKELEEYRQRFEKVMARHRESAEQRIQLATDGDLSTSRSNKEVPMPERPRREQRIEEPRQERDGHRHGLDGPSLGR